LILRLPALPLAASLFLLSPVAFASVRPHRHTSSHAIVRRSASTHAVHASHVAEHNSYAGISSERATEIQSALIQRGYLSGEPTGSWDSSSVAAMQKLQSDNGWQTKFVPDSRALIKLGLGAGSIPAASATAATPATSTSAAVQTPANGQTF
jgi:hypothetical protein